MSGSTSIADGKIVTVHYVLSLDGEGTVADTRADESPMSYLHGAGNIVPGLEAALRGRNVGETLVVRVTPEEGYGERDDDAVQELPRDAFPDDLELEDGMQLTAEDDEGNLTPLIIQTVAEDHVVVDLNHPLAGETLNYEITILEVRDATAEELEHGHAHGEDGHDHDHD